MGMDGEGAGEVAVWCLVEQTERYYNFGVRVCRFSRCFGG